MLVINVFLSTDIGILTAIVKGAFYLQDKILSNATFVVQTELSQRENLATKSVKLCWRYISEQCILTLY